MYLVRKIPRGHLQALVLKLHQRREEKKRRKNMYYATVSREIFVLTLGHFPGTFPRLANANDNLQFHVG